MNTNFNIVKKPKKDEDIREEDEEEIVLEEEKTTSSASAARKKMFSFMAIIVAITILLLFVLYIISLFSKHVYTYSDIETILRDAAVAYFNDNPDSLPKDDGSIVEIDSSNLVAAEKMKDLSEYTKEDVTCSATVQVEKSGTEYLYTPYLNCGDSYVTEELYKKIVDGENIVTSGYGLYSTKNGYIFRGEDVNNYVKLSKSLWRIVKVTSNNNVVLISEDGTPYNQPWDDRYNESRFYESGVNQYAASRVKEYLEKIYLNPSKDDGEDIMSKSDKAKLVSFTLCTAKRTVNSESKDNSEECLEVLKEQKLGLLTLSDYMYASIDPNCKSSATKSCKNYNYLTKDFDWWLVTANKEDSSTVFKVDQNGIAVADNASTYSIVRPVIYLNSKVLYKSGDGTAEHPYRVK